MRRKVVLMLSALVFCCLPAAAQWREGGKAIPDTPWSKSDGDFGASLVFTDKPNELFEAWAKPDEGVHVSDTSTAVRGVPIAAVIFFTGCSPDAHGNCNLVARFITRTPDGKPWGNPFDARIWVDKPPPGKNMLQLSHEYLGVVIDADDPLGKYVVRAEVLDKVSKKQLVLEREFTAVEAPAPKKP